MLTVEVPRSVVEFAKGLHDALPFHAAASVQLSPQFPGPPDNLKCLVFLKVTIVRDSEVRAWRHTLGQKEIESHDGGPASFGASLADEALRKLFG